MFKQHDTSSFKYRRTFDERLNESTKIKYKYNDRCPVICEKSKNQTYLPEIDKIKYLVPTNLTIGQFLFVIRKRMVLKPEEAIFVFINGKIPASGEFMGNIYARNKDADGFLYIQYAKENLFGTTFEKVVPNEPVNNNKQYH